MVKKPSIVVAWGWEKGQRLRGNSHKGAFWGDSDVFYFCKSLGYTGVGKHLVILGKFNWCRKINCKQIEVSIVTCMLKGFRRNGLIFAMH